MFNILFVTGSGPVSLLGQRKVKDMCHASMDAICFTRDTQSNFSASGMA